jgi:hypothetical protein
VRTQQAWPRLCDILLQNGIIASLGCPFPTYLRDRFWIEQLPTPSTLEGIFSF